MLKFSCRNTLALILIGLFLCWPLVGQAQLSVANDVFLNTQPTYPAAGESVTIRLESYLQNIDLATITWYVNNKKFTSGQGVTSITITAPFTGETNVSANVSLLSGDQVTKATTISATTIDILWQAEKATVPPFYRGRSIPTKQTAVKVTAIPPDNFDNSVSYTWEHNGQTLTSQSGFKKRSATVLSSVLTSNHQFRVTARSSSGASTQSSTITVPLGEPEVTFFTNRYLDESISYQQGFQGEIPTAKSELQQIKASPLFFSNDEQPNYEWRGASNNLLTEGSDNIYTTAVIGSTLSANISHPTKILQRITRTISSN